MNTLIQDLKYGLRMLARNPGFTIVAVLTLALGIGANTAIFSMVNGILLRALPCPEPQRLYSVRESVPQFGPGLWPVSGGNFLAWQRDCPAFSAMALLETAHINMIGVGSPKQVAGARVSADIFPMFGIRPELGRLFTLEEDQPGRDHEVILTHQLWAEDFHSDPSVIGRPINLAGSPFTVVGVLPANFFFPKLELHAPALFLPLGLHGGELQPGLNMHNFDCIVRLKPGVSRNQALAQLNSVEARIARQTLGGKFNLYAHLTPLKTAIVGPAQETLWMLTVAAAFVLLIICVNLANLMLARTSARTHEVAMRAALGATRGRLARQLLTEGAILTAIGGALGLWIASLVLDVLVKSAPVDIPRVGDVRIDLGVLAFALAISVISALLFALLPALRLAKVQPGEALKSAGRLASGSKASQRLRSTLVAGQIALCGVLLAGALLLVSSLVRVIKANNWMADQHVLTASVHAPPSVYFGFDNQAGITQRGRFFSDVQQKVEALPGVRSAGFVNTLPLEGSGWGDGVEFQEIQEPGKTTPMGSFRFVSPGYFQTIGLPLVKGRFLTQADWGESVALVSESVVRQVLHGRDPIGMHVKGTSDRGWLRVVGVIGDFRASSDQPPLLGVYMPIWLLSGTQESLVVRTSMDPRGAATMIRGAVSNVSPEAAISQVQTLKTIVDRDEAPRRYETSLSALFAFFAVLLAALGLYGVISYTVGQRTREIGIRIALGAQKSDVLKLVVGQGLKLALIGVAIGIAGALALTRFLSSLLYGVKPTDPLTFIAVSLILIGVALLACYIPARRAAEVDPLVALRYE